jgi:hypothetical protein
MWKHRLSHRLVIILSATILCTLILGSYALQSTMISLEVKEPLEILNYPTMLSVYPGQKIDFEVTIRNNAPITYNVSLDFILNDTSYQTDYVTFSSTRYLVPPEETTSLAAWLTIHDSAPAAQLTLTVAANRNETPSPQPPSPESTPSQTLFAAGAKWASPNGTQALYVNWKDDWLLHGQTDGINWGPWDTVETMDAWRNAVTSALHNDGFNITYAGGIPSSLKGYDLVIIEAAWGAVHPSDSATVRDFVAKGGGVVMLCITPCFFCVDCTDRWPYRFGGTDLTSIADWFGFYSYVNLGGAAYPSFDNPLGTSLLVSDQLFFTSGVSAASVSGPGTNVQVIAQYQAGSDYACYGNAPFAFTHKFGAGRLYWQAHIWPF